MSVSGLEILPPGLRSRIVISPSGCWLWIGEHRKRDNRAVFNKEYVYGILYERLIGPIPDGLVLHHRTCNNKPCVNPWHTVPITQAEHLREHGIAGYPSQSNKTECPAGHPYDETNTRITILKDGRKERSCRICRTQQAREQYYRNLEVNRSKAREYQRRKHGYSARD